MSQIPVQPSGNTATSPAPISVGFSAFWRHGHPPRQHIDDLVLVLHPMRRTRRALPYSSRLLAIDPHLESMGRHRVSGRLGQRPPIFEFGVGGTGKERGDYGLGHWGILSPATLSGNGSEIGSGASLLLPSASNRSRPRSVRSSHSHPPVVVRSAATWATAGPHIMP